jgi:ABC-2 type transport system permease protein
MKAVWATYSRELRAYFFSPLAYVVLFFFLLINGIAFSIIVSSLSDPRSPAGPPLEYFFGGTFLFWLVLLFITPVLTMRLISEELRSGSVEVLMTAPITEGQVVAGKYLAVLTFYAFLWAPTLAYAGLLAHHAKVDWGPVAAGYVGILSLGALLLAMGTFASALTKSQLVAAMITVALLIPLFLFGLVDSLFNGQVAKQVIGYLSLSSHMEELARGIVDTRRLVFYASWTWFFLFLASRALEDKKWR